MCEKPQAMLACIHDTCVHALACITSATVELIHARIITVITVCAQHQLTAMWLLANGHAGKLGHLVVLQSEREDLWKSGEGFCRPDDFPVIQSKAFKALKKT